MVFNEILIIEIYSRPREIQSAKCGSCKIRWLLTVVLRLSNVSSEESCEIFVTILSYIKLCNLIERHLSVIKQVYKHRLCKFSYHPFSNTNSHAYHKQW